MCLVAQHGGCATLVIWICALSSQHSSQVSGQNSQTLLPPLFFTFISHLWFLFFLAQLHFLILFPTLKEPDASLQSLVGTKVGVKVGEKSSVSVGAGAGGRVGDGTGGRVGDGAGGRVGDGTGGRVGDGTGGRVGGGAGGRVGDGAGGRVGDSAGGGVGGDGPHRLDSTFHVLQITPRIQLISSLTRAYPPGLFLPAHFSPTKLEIPT